MHAVSSSGDARLGALARASERVEGIEEGGYMRNLARWAQCISWRGGCSADCPDFLQRHSYLVRVSYVVRCADVLMNEDEEMNQESQQYV
jgi:hypothetical protein